jgi:hypothetical protein
MWQYVGIFSAALAAVLLVLLLWKRREDRRYRAVELADTLALWGFDRLAKLLRAYAVGNYFGANSVGRVTREIVDDMRSGGLPTMLRSIGWKVVEGVFLKNSDDRAKLMELLTTTTPATEIKPPAPTL